MLMNANDVPNLSPLTRGGKGGGRKREGVRARVKERQGEGEMGRSEVDRLCIGANILAKVKFDAQVCLWCQD